MSHVAAPRMITAVRQPKSSISQTMTGIRNPLAPNPEVIVAGGSGQANHGWLEDWRRWQGLTAVQRENLFFIPPSLIQRHTPRILEGAELLCQHLDEARARRSEVSP